MKKILLVLFILTTNVIFSQKVVGHLITNKGERINLYENKGNKKKVRGYTVFSGDVNLTGEYVRYWTKKQKLVKIKQKKVTKLVHGEKRYELLPIIDNKRYRIHEVIAENNEYLLTQYYSSGYYFIFTFRKPSLEMSEYIYRSGVMKDWDLEIYEEVLLRYFGDCSALLDKAKYNIENYEYIDINEQGSVRTVQNTMFNDITNFQCE